MVTSEHHDPTKVLPCGYIAKKRQAQIRFGVFDVTIESFFSYIKLNDKTRNSMLYCQQYNIEIVVKKMCVDLLRKSGLIISNPNTDLWCSCMVVVSYY